MDQATAQALINYYLDVLEEEGVYAYINEYGELRVEHCTHPDVRRGRRGGWFAFRSPQEVPAALRPRVARMMVDAARERGLVDPLAPFERCRTLPVE